jgi:hypothetical protein
MSDWTSFAAWKKFLDTQDTLPASPYSGRKIGRSSRFLYYSNTAPLPSGVHWGAWFAAPGVGELATLLRFSVLPHAFGVWLCRERAQHAELEEIFAEARAGQSEFAQDIPVMERVAGLVSQSAHTAEKSPLKAWKLLGSAVRVFNRRWAGTPTWDFSLKLFDSPQTVAGHVVKFDQFLSLEAKEFRDLASQALTSTKAEKAFRANLHEAAAI